MKNTLILFCLIFSSNFCVAQLTIGLEPFANGFDGPVALENGGDDRMFIVEQKGVIKVRQSNGTVSTFMDIQVFVNNNGNERGLLGLAFHPDYQNNGYFYVNYTRSGGDTKIARYSVSADMNVADVTSEVTIIVIHQPYSNHNGGDIQFGPDGYLYIGMGDGGSAEDPDNNGQNTLELLGKMLRIDVDGGSPYAVPIDNPFVSDPDVLDEIWAIGLRNPWRYSFDALTGDLWVGDVGQYDWEEIDFQPSSSSGGENYGWRCYEGDHTFNTNGCGPAGDYVDPVAEFSHSGGNCSVTGGFVYRGTIEPTLDGKYIYCDYCSGNFWATYEDAGSWVTEQISGPMGFGWSSFGVDMNNELYVVHQDGNIYRIMDACVNYVPSFEVDGNYLTAPEGSSYQWYMNGSPIVGANEALYVITASGDYSLEMTNPDGCTALSQTVSLLLSSIDEIKLFSNVWTFPNPAAEKVNVQFNIQANLKIQVDIFDVLGKQVQSSVLYTKSGMNNFELNIETLSRGLYHLSLSANDRSKTVRFVKQ